MAIILFQFILSIVIKTFHGVLLNFPVIIITVFIQMSRDSNLCLPLNHFVAIYWVKYILKFSGNVETVPLFVYECWSPAVLTDNIGYETYPRSRGSDHCPHDDEAVIFWSEWRQNSSQSLKGEGIYQYRFPAKPANNNSNKTISVSISFQSCSLHTRRRLCFKRN